LKRRSMRALCLVVLGIGTLLFTACGSDHGDVPAATVAAEVVDEVTC
jgi:hypothetical protein